MKATCVGNSNEWAVSSQQDKHSIRYLLNHSVYLSVRSFAFFAWWKIDHFQCPTFASDMPWKSKNFRVPSKPPRSQEGRLMRLPSQVLMEYDVLKYVLNASSNDKLLPLAHASSVACDHSRSFRIQAWHMGHLRNYPALWTQARRIPSELWIHFFTHSLEHPGVIVM